LRILLIEDSDADALRMRRSLERSMENPPEFARALDLAEGVSRCRAEKFDLVLLDLGLPDSMGIGTVERFMREPFDPQPAVVVLTAEDDEALAAQALRLGVEDYVVKGEFGPRPVHRLLRHSFERHRISLERGAVGGARPDGAALRSALGRIRDEATALADSVGDAAAAERLRGIASEAERATAALEKRG